MESFGGGGTADISLSAATMEMTPTAPNNASQAHPSETEVIPDKPASDVKTATLTAKKKNTTATSPKVLRRMKKKAVVSPKPYPNEKAARGQNRKKPTKTLADLIGSKAQQNVGKGAKISNSSSSGSDRKLRSHKS